jgi:hypothetical protein
MKNVRLAEEGVFSIRKSVSKALLSGSWLVDVRRTKGDFFLNPAVGERSQLAAGLPQSKERMNRSDDKKTSLGPPKTKTRP